MNARIMKYNVTEPIPNNVPNFIEYIMTTWHCAKNTECIVTPGFVLKLLSTL